MLDRAGDADGDIDFGGDDLAGLADLIVVGDIACVDRRAACADACAELVRQREDGRGECVGIFQCATARDDDLGRSSVQDVPAWRSLPRRSWTDPASPLPETASIAAEPPVGFCLGKGGTANGDDLLGIARLHGGNRVARIDRAGEGVSAFDAEDIRDLHDVEQGCNARRDILAVAGGREDKGVVMGGKTSNQRRDIFRKLVGISRVIGDMNLGHASDLGSGLGNCAAA